MDGGLGVDTANKAGGQLGIKGQSVGHLTVDAAGGKLPRQGAGGGVVALPRVAG